MDELINDLNETIEQISDVPDMKVKLDLIIDALQMITDAIEKQSKNN